MSRAQLVVGFITIGLWMVSLIVRVIRPATVPEFAPLDGVVLMVFGALYAHGALAPRGPKSSSS